MYGDTPSPVQVGAERGLVHFNGFKGHALSHPHNAEAQEISEVCFSRHESYKFCILPFILSLALKIFSVVVDVAVAPLHAQGIGILSICR